MDTLRVLYHRNCFCSPFFLPLQCNWLCNWIKGQSKESKCIYHSPEMYRSNLGGVNCMYFIIVFFFFFPIYMYLKQSYIWAQPLKSAIFLSAFSHLPAVVCHSQSILNWDGIIMHGNNAGQGKRSSWGMWSAEVLPRGTQLKLLQ